MKVEVYPSDGSFTMVPVSTSAAALVRAGFNPSGNIRVGLLKTMAAAMISELETIRDDREHPGAREAAIAITQLQGASMFAVAAATAGA
jgi:hypothetical protein